MNIKGDGATVYKVVIDHSQNPKQVIEYQELSGSATNINNGDTISNIEVCIRTVKQNILDYITQLGAVLAEGVTIP